MITEKFKINLITRNKIWLKNKKNKKVFLIILVGILLVVISVAYLIHTNSASVILQGVTISNNENFYRDDGFKTYKDGKVVGKKGIDVSEHQGNINWKKVKNSGVEFAIIRCGYRDNETGEIIKDKCFDEYVKGALDQGIEIGVYFFSQAINKEEANEEANFVLDAIRDYDLCYPIGFDMESVSDIDRIDDTSPDEKTAIAKFFCQTIKAQGYEPCIYGNMNWMNKKYNISELSEYNLWLADYNETSDFNVPVVGWQYSNQGTIYGINGDVDLDVFFVANKSQ